MSVSTSNHTKEHLFVSVSVEFNWHFFAVIQQHNVIHLQEQ